MNAPPYSGGSAARVARVTRSFAEAPAEMEVSTVPVRGAGTRSTIVTPDETVPTTAEAQRYSMGDLLHLLNRKAREAFGTERDFLNCEAKERYRRGEITAPAYYRTLARLTQEEVAEASGIPQPYVSKIERGRARLSRDKAVQLAKALGVSAAQLLEIGDDDGE